MERLCKYLIFEHWKPSSVWHFHALNLCACLNFSFVQCQSLNVYRFLGKGNENRGTLEKIGSTLLDLMFNIFTIYSLYLLFSKFIKHILYIYIYIYIHNGIRSTRYGCCIWTIGILMFYWFLNANHRIPFFFHFISFRSWFFKHSSLAARTRLISPWPFWWMFCHHEGLPRVPETCSWHQRPRLPITRQVLLEVPHGQRAYGKRWMEEFGSSWWRSTTDFEKTSDTGRSTICPERWHIDVWWEITETRSFPGSVEIKGIWIQA